MIGPTSLSEAVGKVFAGHDPEHVQDVDVLVRHGAQPLHVHPPDVVKKLCLDLMLQIVPSVPHELGTLGNVHSYLSTKLLQLKHYFECIFHGY